jgi:hypothetical protein
VIHNSTPLCTFAASRFAAKPEEELTVATEEESVKRKQSKWEQILDTVKKTTDNLLGTKPKPTVEWREELKKRDKAKQMAWAEGLVQGMPEYKVACTGFLSFQ